MIILAIINVISVAQKDMAQEMVGLMLNTGMFTQTPAIQPVTIVMKREQLLIHTQHLVNNAVMFVLLVAVVTNGLVNVPETFTNSDQ